MVENSWNPGDLVKITYKGHSPTLVQILEVSLYSVARIHKVKVLVLTTISGSSVFKSGSILELIPTSLFPSWEKIEK